MPKGIYKRTEYHNAISRKNGFQKGYHPKNEFKKGHKGSEKQKIAMSKRMEGKNNHKWKGNNVQYRALHEWIRRKLGIPKICEFCGKIKTTPKSIHWANKSGKYMRDLTDWISLCIFCHKKYDKGRIIANTKK